MASRSADEFSPFAGVDRFRFHEDGGCCLDGRLFDGLGASPYFVTCRERLKGTGGVLAIVEVDVKCLPEIAPRDEGCSWTSPIDVPTVRTETIPGVSAMFLALSIGLNVFDRFHRWRTPSIRQRVSLDTMEREASDNRHAQILNQLR